MKARYLVLAAIAALAIGGVALAQGHGNTGMTGQGMMGGMGTHAMMSTANGQGQNFEAMRDAMMSRMDAMDTKLDGLVAKMDDARGSRKVEAMASVIDEMVTQRKAMRRQWTAMQPQMMRMMMERMGAGMMQGMMSSMNTMPMEASASGDGAPPPMGGSHEAHHGTK